MKNTEGCPAAGGRAPQEQIQVSRYKNKKRRPKVSPRLIIFVFDYV